MLIVDKGVVLYILGHLLEKMVSKLTLRDSKENFQQKIILNRRRYIFILNFIKATQCLKFFGGV